jgi:hypothetical protein
MRQYYLQRIPATPEQQQKRDLLEEKAKHYEKVAQKCLASGNASTIGESPCSDIHRSIASDPRSPLAKHGFFNDESSVIPIPVPSGASLRSQLPNNGSSLSTVVNQTTSQANAKLAQAMDADERGEKQSAIDTYMMAAELYLKAIKACESEGEGKSSKGDCGENVALVLKRRMENTLGECGVCAAGVHA